jgi:ABC-type lipoprotein export system ATPase subunit
MSEAVVELRDVFCVHRTNEGDAAALAGTNLELARGEVLCVLGPSGAGKSTLLRVVAGIQEPSAGVVRVLGRDIGRMPARSRSRFRHELVGFLGQHAEAALSPELRMRDAVCLPLALRGVPRRERRRRVDELLEATALAERADALPGELSGGERQRFALCAALAHRPALLLADEPTGELDDASAGTIRALIVELARTNGTSVILVTHDPATAEAADRTLVIRDGRIVGDRRGGQESLVVDDGWLRLPSELLTQAGIGPGKGRRARVRPAPDGVIVTPAVSDSGPAGPAVSAVSAGQAGQAGQAIAKARPQPPAQWAPVQVGLVGVARTYGHALTRRQVLGGLTHDFAPGRMTVITGRSGTGKTTLLKLVAGLDRPSSGQVVLDGHPLGDRSGEQLASLRRERIGYLPQEPAPIGFLSAEENAVLVLRIRGWDAEAAAERAASALTRAGLADRARQRASRLSAGEAQRLALARALASARGLLIVDEPTSRQDENNARAVAALLAAAAHEEGQTVICATHDPAVIGQADHVVVLDGRGMHAGGLTLERLG